MAPHSCEGVTLPAFVTTNRKLFHYGIQCSFKTNWKGFLLGSWQDGWVLFWSWNLSDPAAAFAIQVNLEWQTTKHKEYCIVHYVWYEVETEGVLTPHKLIFCLNSFSPSNITLISSWRKKGKKKLSWEEQPFKTLLSCAITHHGTVCIYVT